ncbi:hypothetical protein CRUP_025404, partial [Coryphaenoides rupestris]
EKDEEAGQSFGGGARNDGGHDAEESRWDKYRLNPPLEVEELEEEPEETGSLSRSHLHCKGNARWTQFLPVPHPQEEDGEEESCLVNNMESKPLDRLGSSATSCSLSHIRDLGHQSELPKAV